MDPGGTKLTSDAMKERGAGSNIHFFLDVVSPVFVYTTKDNKLFSLDTISSGH